MTHFFIKKNNSICMLLIFLHISNPATATEKSWASRIAQEPLTLLTIGTLAVIIGKISYNYYQTNQIIYEQAIENCRKNYKKIHQDTQYYHHLYYNDVQMSNWELKEIIIENSKEPYPFIAYHTSLAKGLWTLRKNLLALNNQLKKVEDLQKQLLHSNKTEKTVYIEEMLFQLTIKGKQLQEYLINTTTLITILKKRIKIFKEYNDDCYNWAQAERKKDKALLQS